MLYHEQQAIYGWPDVGAGGYRLTIWDCLADTEKILDENYQALSYACVRPDDQPALLLVYPILPVGVGRPFTFPIASPQVD